MQQNERATMPTLGPDDRVTPLQSSPSPNPDDRLESAQLQTTLVLPRQAAPPRSEPLNWRRALVAALLIGYDALLLNLAFFLAYFVRFDVFKGITFVSASPFVSADITTLRLFQVALVATMLCLVTARGLYRLRMTGTLVRQFNIWFTSAAIGFALYSIYEFLLRSTPYVLAPNTRAVVIFAWAGAVIVPFIGRFALTRAIMLGYRLGLGRTRVLIVGAGRTGKIVMQHFAALGQQGYQVVGFINERDDGPPDFGRFSALGMLDDLEWVIHEQQVQVAIIALPSANQGQVARAVRICERNHIAFRLVPGLQEFSLTRVDLEMVEGLPLLRLRLVAAHSWQRALKRTLDLLSAMAILTVGAPLWALVAVLIRLDSPGPAIYRQQRIGLNGQSFTAYKFRSMAVDADAHRRQLAEHNRSGRGLFKLKRDPRVTRVGRVLRRTSLDEIPQLLNVLRGEMALVGPRPPLPDEYSAYEAWEKRRLEAVPGLTGLWQVRGRSDLVFEEMVLMDLYYLENWTLQLDLHILAKTLPVVLFGRGAY